MKLLMLRFPLKSSNRKQFEKINLDVDKKKEDIPTYISCIQEENNYFELFPF